MLRSELDALPLEEQTNLEFASTRRMIDQVDIERPVMHACGHDMHLTCLLAASELCSQHNLAGTVLWLFFSNRMRNTLVERRLCSKMVSMIKFLSQI